MSSFAPGTPWSVINETNQKLYGVDPVAEPPGWSTQNIPPPGYTAPTGGGMGGFGNTQVGGKGGAGNTPMPPVNPLQAMTPATQGYVSPYTRDNLAERFPNLPPEMQQRMQQQTQQNQRALAQNAPPPWQMQQGNPFANMGNMGQMGGMAQSLPLMRLLFGGMGGMGGMMGGMANGNRRGQGQRQQQPPQVPRQLPEDQKVAWALSPEDQDRVKRGLPVY